MRWWLAAGGMALLLALAVQLQADPEATSKHGFGSWYERYAVPADDLYKSPIQLAVTADGSTLYVSCENTDEVLQIHVEERKVIKSRRVGRMPFGLLLTKDESRLYVSNRWDDTVSLLDADTLEILTTFAVGDDPHGLVLDEKEAFLYVANLGTNDVSVLGTSDHREVKRLAAGAGPFGLARANKHIYVSNQWSNAVPFRTPPVLELTTIDSEKQWVVDRRSLHSTVIGQGLAVSPDNQFVAIALELPKNLIPETQIYQGWMVTHGFVVAETAPGGRLAYLLIDEPHLYFADPYGIVFSPDNRYLYIGSSGVDTVTVVDVPKLMGTLHVQDGKIGLSDEQISQSARHLALSNEYVAARIPTGANPKGIAISPDGKWLYVADRLGDTISILDAREFKPAGEIDLGGPTQVTELRKGAELFNYSSISFQKQLSCNTCHPENHLDGLTYDIAIDGGMGRNLVDNRTLRGIGATPPFKWSGKNPNLQRQEGPRAAQLFFRSHGYVAHENEAIVHFIEAMGAPPNRYQAADGELTRAQRRGKYLYERAYTNEGRYIPVANRCNTCHPAPFFTDLRKHNVGARAETDTANDTDTPHLNNIYDGAPYMHDGRCYSLEEIWTMFNPDDLHGVTNDMTKQQLNDLIEYIKTF